MHEINKVKWFGDMWPPLLRIAQFLPVGPPWSYFPNNNFPSLHNELGNHLHCTHICV